MDYAELLEHSFQVTNEFGEECSRLMYLSDYIFDFTTYDSEPGELFAAKALEVCGAVNSASTFDYIKDAENYRWYLLMVNMPFFADRLDWGTSIRGAWWAHEDQPPLKSCGLWIGEEQALEMNFTSDEWKAFTKALIDFAPTPSDSSHA